VSDAGTASLVVLEIEEVKRDSVVRRSVDR
jgi:hypothetical protein